MRALRVVGVAEARTPVMETVMAAIFSVRRLGQDEEWVFNRLRVHECAPTRVGDGLSGAVGRVEFPERGEQSQESDLGFAWPISVRYFHQTWLVR
jgi:hypothetical protein